MIHAVILVSATAEWNVVRDHFADIESILTPYGESFRVTLAEKQVVFFHGGWGKISAAGSTQYAIATWQPEVLINIGTCGGFDGRIQKGEVILAEKTIVYDIIEQMGDPAEAIADYSTTIETDWLGTDLPEGVSRGLLLSADKDLASDELDHLQQTYDGIAGDWESGAIAWVAERNNQPVIILRSVSDVVSATHAEAYAGIEAFEAGTKQVMDMLIKQLPFWLTKLN